MLNNYNKNNKKTKERNKEEIRLKASKQKGLDETKRTELLAKELWTEENFRDFVLSEQEYVRSKYVDSAKYKRYKRMLKKQS